MSSDSPPHATELFAAIQRDRNAFVTLAAAVAMSIKKIGKPKKQSQSTNNVTFSSSLQSVEIREPKAQQLQDTSPRSSRPLRSAFIAATARFSKSNSSSTVLKNPAENEDAENEGAENEGGENEGGENEDAEITPLPVGQNFEESKTSVVTLRSSLKKKRHSDEANLLSASSPSLTVEKKRCRFTLPSTNSTNTEETLRRVASSSSFSPTTIDRFSMFPSYYDTATATTKSGRAQVDRTFWRPILADIKQLFDDVSVRRPVSRQRAMAVLENSVVGCRTAFLARRFGQETFGILHTVVVSVGRLLDLLTMLGVDESLQVVQDLISATVQRLLNQAHQLVPGNPAATIGVVTRLLCTLICTPSSVALVLALHHTLVAIQSDCYQHWIRLGATLIQQSRVAIAETTKMMNQIGQAVCARLEQLAVEASRSGGRR